MNYAYLHGFASSSDSRKGGAIAEHLEERGVELHIPELNYPSFAELTYTGMLEAVSRYDERYGGGEPWSFIGSSMGGYVAARWSELHPERVDRLVLLCPGFGMVERWAELLGEQGIEDWREEGSFLFFDAEDQLTAVDWELYADARDRHPAYPDIDHPVRILHGEEDEIVPIENSRRFVSQTEGAELVLLEDDHKLYDSVPTIVDQACEWFGIA